LKSFSRQRTVAAAAKVVALLFSPTAKPFTPQVADLEGVDRLQSEFGGGEQK